MFKQHILVVSLGFAMGLVASACVTTFDSNPSHCRNAAGDQTCAERYGRARPFCTSAACDSASEGVYGCVAARPSNDCYYPCGGDNDVTVDDSCVLAGDGDGDGDGDLTSGDGDPTNGDGDVPCMASADCTDSATPFCDVDAGLCVGCGSVEDPDGACAGLDAQLPVCAADVCVACTQAKPDLCIEDTPICDPQTNTCMGCSDHDQCPDSACNLAVGSCFDPANTLHVDGDVDDDECVVADGSEAIPYCTLGDALAKADSQALIILHELDFDNPYEESNEISKTIALFAASGEFPVLAQDTGDAPLTVGPSGLLFARGIEISEVEENDGGGLGLIVAGGQAWVQQCKVVDNEGGGILVDGGALVLENSFVGGDNNDVAALEVITGKIAVVFSTLVAAFGESHALVCTDGDGVTVRNSILVSRSDDTPAVDCPKSTVVDSFTQDEPVDGDWFLDFKKGDFHLVAGEYPSEVETTASWQTGDPLVDIDGDERPTDTPTYAGADQP